MISHTKSYVIDQLTRQDRVYNETGALFLLQIDRKSKNVDDIVNNLLCEFEDISFEELKADFMEFLECLEKARFIVTGDSEEELNEKDLEFTYNVSNPKTYIDDFTQETKEVVFENTQDFFFRRGTRTSIDFWITI